MAQSTVIEGVVRNADTNAKANVGLGFMELTAEYYSSFEDLSNGTFFFGISVLL